jgi:hypothetical protein
MCMIQNDLAIFIRDLENPMSLGISQLDRFSGDRAKKRGGGRNEGFSHDVTENIRSEIAILGLAIMCMKIKVVIINALISV